MALCNRSISGCNLNPAVSIGTFGRLGDSKANQLLPPYFAQ
ncbi:UNVERIFIED_CONTAM: hypothetical protein GTU68_006912 [Idotea baltica]|nr:hypothetical protein [Idotea baltica]